MAPFAASPRAARHMVGAFGVTSDSACAATRDAEHTKARSVIQKGARIPHLVQPTAMTHMIATIQPGNTCKGSSDGPFRPRWPS
eukprot:5279533-Pleurochrysis_carterae.AAC.1